MRNFKSFSRAAPVITKSSHEVSSYPLLDAFGWEKLISNRKKHKTITVFKSSHNVAPVYHCWIFCRFSVKYDLLETQLRNKLASSKLRAEYLKRSFSYSTAALRNSLPQDRRKCNSLEVFKKKLKNYYNSSLASHITIM